MGKTKFQHSWKKNNPWLQEVPSDIYMASCTICLKRFRINGSGISQVNSHAKVHKKGTFSAGQQQLSACGGNLVMKKNNKKTQLSTEDQVLNAEILQAVHMVDYNQSFSSASPDNERFKKMFPDSEIARAYKQGETKVMYSIKFGIAPFLKQQMMNRLKGVPFTFKFDETTTCQVKKTV